MTFETALFARHEIRYTTEHPVPVKDVIASLQGLQRISAHFLPRTLSALTGVEVLSADLFVEGFEQGSFVEDVLVKLVFGSQEKLDAFLKKANESVVAEAREIIVKHPIISVAVLALLAYGAAQAYSAMNDGQQSSAIQANNNVINIIGAESYKMDPQAFARVLTAAVGADRKKIAQDSARVLAPAKNEAAAIILDGNQKLSITSAAVKEVPAKVEFDERPLEETYPDVDLQIRAIDRDKVRQGWKGLIPGLVDRRVPLKLSDSVDAEELAKYATVRADVRIVYRRDKSGNLKPQQIAVDRLVQADDE
ncbi:hypothetical protein QFZ41_002580 [Luteibacter sp. W1I16]|uniref:hypothetical protein n=1 Tax=Luteibacter sp. W1I16 TaxID=3373922 RepID=UPI003D1FAF31